MKILIIDIESTTFLEKGGKIWEIGITEVDLVARKKQLIYDKMFNDGLTEDELMTAWGVKLGHVDPKEIAAADPLKKHLPVVQSIIDAYPDGATAFNNGFDFKFLEHYGITFPKKLSCLMLACTDICKLPGNYGQYKWPKAEEAYLHFFPGSDWVELHRGGDDSFHEADIAIELFNRGLIKEMSEPVKKPAPAKSAPVKKENQTPIVASKGTTEFIQEIDRIVHTNNMPAVIGEQIKTKYVPYLQVIYQVAEEARVINFENPSEEDQELARALRLRLVPNRTGADKFKKQEKAEKALLNKLEDHSFGVIDTQSRLLEGRLAEVEKFQEIQAQKKKAELEATRSELLKPYVENPLIYPIDTMSQAQFDDLLKSQKLLADQKAKEAQDAAEAETKRKAAEELHNKRKDEMIPYWQFLNDDQKAIIWGVLEQDQYDALLADVKTKKEQADKAAADQQAENERLKKAEVENQRRQDELKSIGMFFDGELFYFQRFVGETLSYDFSAIKEMTDNKFKVVVDYAKKEIKTSRDNEQATLDHKIKGFSRKLTKVGWIRQTPEYFVRNMGEGEPPYRLEIKTLEGWNDAQLTQKIDEVEALIEKRAADKAAAAEKKAAANLAKSGDKTKLAHMINSVQVPLVTVKSEEAKKIHGEIALKLAGWQKWALSEIEKL